MEHYSLPKDLSLKDFHTRLDTIIDDVVKVADFVQKYGAFIPGSSQIVAPLALLEKALKLAKTFLDTALP